MHEKEIIQNLLGRAGVALNGMAPWDVHVSDERFYKRVLSQGSLGLGESYMDNWWDVQALDQFIYKVLKADLSHALRPSVHTALLYLRSTLFNMQSRTGSRVVVDTHYDLDLGLYMSFLGPYNQYTSGYYNSTDDLNKAEELRLDLICRKLQLKAEDRVLDIGCGWGGFAKFASERYGCLVTGITNSAAQAKYARKFTAGLPVVIELLDYRDLTGGFDKILICGMIEHVGYKNYRTIAEIVKKILKPNGLFLLDTIGGNKSIVAGEPWIDKYIFPGGMTPSAAQLTKAFEGLFIIEDWHNFGVDYDRTVMAWLRNFQKAWPKLLQTGKYDERFRRMWEYYLCSFAGAFRARVLQQWQIVLSHKGIPKGYPTVR